MEQILYRILIYTAMLSAIVLLLSLSYFLVNLIRLKRKQVAIEEFATNISSDIEESTFGLMDKVIQESFNEYIALNIEYREDIEYIDADLEKIITQDVSHKVVDRISPALMSRISLIYNINNFETLLSERVYLFTMDYSIRKNAVKKEE